MKIAFFGTDNFSTAVLNKLKNDGLTPNLIISVPDRKSGRGQKIEFSPVKKWATEFGVEILQPEKLDAEFVSKMRETDWDIFLVASYGKSIPHGVLEIPKFGAINIHPSILPKYRGASPIESAIINDEKETGVTLITLDEKMDHGPIIDAQFLKFEEWPNKIEVENKLAQIGAKMFLQLVNEIGTGGKFKSIPQRHNEATFTKKIKKEDGLVKIDKLKTRATFLKIKALNPWPGAYFFIDHLGKQMRVKIVDAEWNEEETKITKIIPEGKKEMDFDSFKNGFIAPTTLL